MKVTEYFKHVRIRLDRANIKEEWIQKTLADPEHRITQSDGRIRHWRQISQAEGRWLRVVTLADGETVHNAFFDRRFKGDSG
jgi:hypothetical protein